MGDKGSNKSNNEKKKSFLKNGIEKVAQATEKVMDVAADSSGTTDAQMEWDYISKEEEEELSDFIKTTYDLVFRTYTPNIKKYKVYDNDKSSGLVNRLRFIKVDRLVKETKYNPQKLLNIYRSLPDYSNFAIVVENRVEETNLYFALISNHEIEEPSLANSLLDRLESSMYGNYPGIKLNRKCEIPSIFNDVLSPGSKVNKGNSLNIGQFSCIPSLKDEEYITQSLDKIINGYRPRNTEEEYSILLIACPVTKEEIMSDRSLMMGFYTNLYPFLERQLNKSEIVGVSKGITAGIGLSMNKSNFTSKSFGLSAGLSAGLSVAAGVAGGALLGPPGAAIGSYLGKTIGGSIGGSMSSTSGNASGFGASLNASKQTTKSKSTQDGIVTTSLRRDIKYMLDNFDNKIERLNVGEAIGLWEYGAYVISKDYAVTSNVMSSYKSLVLGQESYANPSFTEIWEKDHENTQRILKTVTRLQHPKFFKSNDETNKAEDNVTNPLLSLTSLINGNEIIVAMGLPQMSMSKLPVLDCPEFGRSVLTYNNPESNQLDIGCIFHMQREENTRVSLDINSLTGHTFITGSTGSGKSNTVYNMIDDLSSKKVKFLVVEPAKGEYKHYFGHRENVNVYGTNEELTELLKINPFEFPKSIHVLEHADRLIEIFNVCWPMYAAMPAILKEALLLSYEKCGWDLKKSRNVYSDDLFPTFKDLLFDLTVVINSSAYSEEIKNNYTGSLITRIKSLTNGINGSIFTSNALSDEILFDQDTIIDLSRVGSSETKSLLMGLIVMKLNEYRMDQAGLMMNQELKHVTILEEAHNLLKNSSNINTMSEGNNMSGKSIEMLSNSIAEMRTYGEGFIIVDQSPNAVDISAIRNTNTKIIMRLPEDSDRQQAGKSAALTDEQIPELAKLGRGVAVVYQNDWLEPVLCKIKKADVEGIMYKIDSKQEDDSKSETIEELLKLLMENRVEEKIDYDIDRIKENINDLDISTQNKIRVRNIIEKASNMSSTIDYDEQPFEIISNVVVDLLDCSRDLQRFTKYNGNPELLQNALNRVIARSVICESKEFNFALSQCILRQLVEANKTTIELYSEWKEYAINSRKVY